MSWGSREKRFVEQVCGCVVGLAAAACLEVDACREGSLGVGGQLGGEVNGQVVFAFGVEYFDALVVIFKHTLVAHLSAHFGVEGGGVEHEFVEGLLLLLHAAVAQNAAGSD